MTRRGLRICSGALTRRARLIATVATAISVSACASDTREPIRLPAETAFCARYFDGAHPPVWIYESDSATEKEEKTDLIILWERECAIRPEA